MVSFLTKDSPCTKQAKTCTTEILFGTYMTQLCNVDSVKSFFLIEDETAIRLLASSKMLCTLVKTSKYLVHTYCN